MRPQNSRFRLGSAPSKSWFRPAFRVASFGSLALAVITACGTSNTNTPFDNGSGTGTNSTTHSNSTHVATITQTSTSTLADGAVVTTTHTTTTTEVASNSSTTSHSGSGNNTSSGTGSNGGNSSSTSSSSGSGSATDSDGGDGGGCTNTDTSTINIDSSGWVCNNKWGIQGAWYCYADTGATTDCGPTGYIPYSSSKNAMCISGTLPGTSSAYTGAALGLVLNQPAHGSTTKNAFNTTAQNIVGFAITISGTTGGSVINVNFPPQLLSTGEAASVTLPAVNNTTTTFNVLIANAIMSDNSTSPVPKLDPTKLTDVQVALPGGDQIAHAYNFCVTSIVPLTAAPAAPSSLTTYGASFNEGKQIAVEGLGPYAVQNDVFHLGSASAMAMTASYGGGKVGFTATPSWSGSSLNAYPSIVSGQILKTGEYVSVGSGGYAGGKTVGALTSVTSDWSWSAPSASGWGDAAYDIWFSDNPNSLGVTLELMIWLGRNGVNPLGGGNTAVTVASSSGSGNVAGSWTYSTCGSCNAQNSAVISYVAGSDQTSVSNFDVLAFIKDVVKNNRVSGNPVSSSSYLLSVQAGFEAYVAGTYTTSSYDLTIQ